MEIIGETDRRILNAQYRDLLVRGTIIAHLFLSSQLNKGERKESLYALEEIIDQKARVSQQLKKLDQIANCTYARKEQQIRACAICLYFGGMSTRKIAGFFLRELGINVNYRTVWGWIKNYRSKGIEGILSNRIKSSS